MNSASQVTESRRRAGRYASLPHKDCNNTSCIAFRAYILAFMVLSFELPGTRRTRIQPGHGRNARPVSARRSSARTRSSPSPTPDGNALRSNAASASEINTFTSVSTVAGGRRRTTPMPARLRTHGAGPPPSMPRWMAPTFSIRPLVTALSRCVRLDQTLQYGVTQGRTRSHWERLGEFDHCFELLSAEGGVVADEAARGSAPRPTRAEPSRAECPSYRSVLPNCQTH